MTRLRLLAVVLLATALAGALAVAAVRERGSERQAPDAADPVRTGAVAVLHGWDRRRAAAWRRGAPGALGDLYTRDSVAGRSDRAALAAYADRGLRVTGMRMQVADVVVRTETRHRIVLLVTDRLVGAIAVGRGTSTALPADRWSTRRIMLLRVGESWRVAEVTDQPSPVASTDSTSGSANS